MPPKRGRTARPPELEGTGPDNRPYRVLKDGKKHKYRVYYGVETKQTARLTSTTTPTHEEVFALLQSKAIAAKPSTATDQAAQASASSAATGAIVWSSSLSSAAAAASPPETEAPAAAPAPADNASPPNATQSVVDEGRAWVGADSLPSSRERKPPAPKFEPTGRKRRNYEKERDRAYTRALEKSSKEKEHGELQEQVKRQRSELDDLRAQIDNAINDSIDSVESFVDSTTKVGQRRVRGSPSRHYQDALTFESRTFLYLRTGQSS